MTDNPWLWAIAGVVIFSFCWVAVIAMLKDNQLDRRELQQANGEEHCDVRSTRSQLDLYLRLSNKGVALLFFIMGGGTFYFLLTNMDFIIAENPNSNIIWVWIIAGVMIFSGVVLMGNVNHFLFSAHQKTVIHTRTFFGKTWGDRRMIPLKQISNAVISRMSGGGGCLYWVELPVTNARSLDLTSAASYPGITLVRQQCADKVNDWLAKNR